MKRPFRRFEVACLAAALASAAGCTPNNSVKPGAPVLTEVSIVEGGGATVTSIPPAAAACPAATATGTACDPSSPSGATCFLASAKNWCRCGAVTAPAAPTPPPVCTDGGTPDAGAATATDGGSDAGATGADSGAPDAADAAAAPAGLWNCDPFAPTAMALFIFDRVLDTEPFTPDADDAVALSTTPTSTSTAAVDYASNGTPGEVIFPLLGAYRSDGPSLLVSGSPALPVNAAVTFALSATNVRAKDHKTPFTDLDNFNNHNFNSGSLTFAVSGFIATLAVPMPAAPGDPCAPVPTTVPADMTPATLSFTNLVDPAAVAKAITVQSTGGTTGDVPVDVASADGLNVTITPKTAWPTSSTITVTVKSGIKDLAGDPLPDPPPAAQSFTTGAM